MFDESAYKDKRDEFDRALADIYNSTEKVMVVFDKVDRFSRNIFDPRTPKLLKLSEEDKIEIHFASDNIIIHKNMNAMQKSQFHMSLVFAQYYSGAISDNIKRAHEKMRRDGKITAGCPLGHLNVAIDPTDPKSKRTVIIDPVRGFYVARGYELYATSQYSDDKIADVLYEEGFRSKKGKRVSKSNITKMLTNPFYIGISKNKVREYPHSYARIFQDRELWDLCQEIRVKKNKNIKTHTKKLSHIFKGIAKCSHCGCSMTPEGTKNAGNNYYVCSNSKNLCNKTETRVNEKDLLKPIYELMDKFANIPEHMAKTIDEEINKSINYEKEYRDKQILTCQKEYDKWKNASDKLVRDYYADNLGSITNDDYDKMLQEFKDKQQIAEIRLSEFTKADYTYKNHIVQVINLCRRAKVIFNSSTTEEKNKLLKFLLTNCEVRKKTFIYQVKSPFTYILQLNQPTLCAH